MKLNLKSTGSTAGFVTWLKEFKDILPSLLIEVDLDSQEFIAKSFPAERCIVKYSKISFEDAGYELFGITDNDGNPLEWSERTETSSGRVLVGIYQILGKFIDVANMFAEADHDLDISFDICNNVQYIQSKTSEKEYTATAVTFSSLSLTMNISCSQISEYFTKLDDDTFLNRVCNIGSPSTYEVSADAITNLAKISSVFVSDKLRDAIKIYSKVVDGERGLYAYDETKGSYDYLLGYYVSGEDGDTSTVIFRENFMNATKGLTADTLQITLDTAGASRILVDADTSKVIIAAVQKN